MTVRELIAKLQAFDQSLEVACQRYSDYQLVDDTDPFLIKGVPKGGDYIMRDHATLPANERWGVRDYVCFSGN